MFQCPANPNAGVASATGSMTMMELGEAGPPRHVGAGLEVQRSREFACQLLFPADNARTRIRKYLEHQQVQHQVGETV